MRACCIFQLCIFSTMDLFFSQISVQTNQILSRHNCSSVPDTCQVPIPGCPHQKTNPREWYSVASHRQLLYTMGQRNISLTVHWEPCATERKKKHKGGKDSRQRRWGDSSNSSSFPFQKLTTVMCWLSKKLECYIKFCSASCIHAYTLK